MSRNDLQLRGQIKIILEDFKYDAESNKIAETIRKALESVYSKTSYWGKIQNEDCETRIGVIKIFPHSDKDEWSILNRFDTNYKVRNKLKDIKNFEDSENRRKSNSFRPIEFSEWITQNKERLFKIDYPNGFVKNLVELNKTTIDEGNKNEDYAIESLRNVLEEKYGQGNVKLKRFCAGSIVDMLKGVDMEATVNGKTTRYQIKPFTTVISKSELDGTTYFEVRTKSEILKYKDENVDAFLFVNTKQKQFILFDYDINKISEIRSGVRFYEAPLSTNIGEIKNKIENEKNSEVSNLFGASAIEKKIANLEYRQNQIQHALHYYRQKLKYNY